MKVINMNSRLQAVTTPLTIEDVARKLSTENRNLRERIAELEGGTPDEWCMLEKEEGITLLKQVESMAAANSHCEEIRAKCMGLSQAQVDHLWRNFKERPELTFDLDYIMENAGQDKFRRAVLFEGLREPIF